MKKVFDIMDETDESIQNFNEACTQLCSSKFFLAPKVLSKLLQIIAGSKKLYALIQSCTANFSYSAALRKAKRDKNGKKSINIDDCTRREQIAFTFCLLFSFDCQKTDMQKFVHTYYEGDTIIEEFASFCKQIVEPFRINIIAELEGWIENPPQVMNVASRGIAKGKSKEIKDEDVIPSGAIELFKKKIDHRFVADEDAESYLDDLQAQNLLKPLREIIDATSSNQSLDVKEKEEILLISEAFEKSLEFGGISTVKIMFIALKNTLKVSKLARSLSEQIKLTEQFLTEYGIF